MECWYFSPFPKEYYPDGYVDTLYFCEYTLRWDELPFLVWLCGAVDFGWVLVGGRQAGNFILGCMYEIECSGSVALTLTVQGRDSVALTLATRTNQTLKTIKLASSVLHPKRFRTKSCVDLVELMRS